MRARELTGSAVATCFALLLAAAPASAQAPEAAPAPAETPAAPAPPVPEHGHGAPAAPAPAPGPGMMQQHHETMMRPHHPPGPPPTDHSKVVGLWGVEARRMATVQRTRGQDIAGCNNDCPVDLNAISLRRWVSPNYAYTFGLALGLGGGSRRGANGAGTESFDTYLGVGPTLGASFALAEWRHVTVSFSPSLDFLFFMPGGSRPKTLMLEGRGVFEGEVHLGFWGIPQLSVALATGLGAGWTYVTKGDTPLTNQAASSWAVGFTGQQSLWGLVTNAAVRYYF